MKSKLSNTLWGFLFILFGIGIAGNTFDLWDFNLFFSGWWTLFIIIPSISSIIKNGFRTSNIIGITIGVLLLLSCQDVIDSEVIGKLIVPLIFVIIGLNILFHSLTTKQAYKFASNYTNHAGNADYTEIFSSRKYVHNEAFYGATINAIFGGCELDLRNSIITEDVVLDCTTIFGGADIYVPSNVKVKISSVPIFGGISNKSIENVNPNAPVFYINATCIFGGVDVK